MNRVIMTIIALIGLVVFTTDTVFARATAMSEPHWTYALSEYQIFGTGATSCTHRVLTLNGTSAESCKVGTANQDLYAKATASISPNWKVTVYARARGRQGGTKQPLVTDTMYLTATAVLNGNTLNLQGQRNTENFGTLELAVIDFSGDSSLLNNLDILGVDDLTNKLLIPPANVKLKKTFGEIDPNFNYNIDVTGVQRIVVFAMAEEHTPDIPTLSEWALMIFSVLLLGLMTYYVIKRRQLAREAV